MDIVDLHGNPITSPDMEKGRLESRIRTVHHDAVAEVAEISRMEVFRQYANGGKDVVRVVDVPGVAGQPAYDEQVPYQVYIPYTDAEMARMHNPPLDADALGEILLDQDYRLIALEMGVTLT